MPLRGARAVRLMPLSLAMILACMLIAILSSFGRDTQWLSSFYISEYIGGGLREVFRGQVWRLITPIFMHFGVVPVLFNMLWLFALGGAIERGQGTRRLAVLVAVCGIGGNLAQFWWAGPDFGGMSGVAYGLLAYLLVQGRLQPRNGLVLHRYIVLMMLIWFVLCWTGIINAATNMAHTIGLLCGGVLGWLYSSNKRLTAQQS
ncbi:MAG: rhomboid family intramembrane serine protease [Gammaproteobacteria bacterium]|nr:rhomboid family intramembrane serine protease [Gammaproteobacteria bacterium]